jgi:hypothetical protein
MNDWNKQAPGADTFTQQPRAVPAWSVPAALVDTFNQVGRTFNLWAVHDPLNTVTTWDAGQTIWDAGLTAWDTTVITLDEWQKQ